MTANLELVRRTYEGSSEENGRNLLAAPSSDVEWTEAEGFPYAGTNVGVEGRDGGRLPAPCHRVNRLIAHPHLADGDRVAAFGVYSGTYKATGKPMAAAFAHLYEVKDGKIARMTQYVDTAMVQKALV